MALGTIAQISLSLGQQIMDFAAHSTLSKWSSNCKILCTTYTKNLLSLSYSKFFIAKVVQNGLVELKMFTMIHVKIGWTSSI